MAEEEALEVLCEHSGATAGQIPQQEALQVSRDCGFLALALAIVGSLDELRNAPASPEAWRKVHEDLKNTMDKLRLKSDSVSLQAALDISFDGLGRDTQERFRV